MLTSRKPTIAKNDVQEAKRRVYVCRTHQVPMEYDAEHVLWACPEAGCKARQNPEVWNNLDKKPVVLHSSNVPELCGVASSDDPSHSMSLFLYYRDLNIVVPLPNVVSFEGRTDGDAAPILYRGDDSILRVPRRRQYIVEIAYEEVTILSDAQVGQ